MQAQSGVELSVLGSWSLPKEGQEGMESFLRDLSTIFPQRRWLQVSREIGKTGFICDVLNRDQSKTVILDIHYRGIRFLNTVVFLVTGYVALHSWQDFCLISQRMIRTSQSPRLE